METANNVQVFENKEFGSVRVVMIDDDAWMCGADVAAALGYKNSRKAVADHVEDEDKRDGVTIRDAIGRDQKAIMINESGLYSLILSSKLPKAKEFKRWVTSDVLPSIRKHGIYATEDIASRAIADPDWMINLLTNYKKEREERRRAEAEASRRLEQIEEMKPKVQYCDRILQSPEAIAISVIAKDYGKSAKWLNKKLCDMGVQYKQGDVWLLYAKYADKGYTKTDTYMCVDSDGQDHSRVHTKWTQKGRMFLYDLLKANGIIPICEQEEEEIGA